MLYSLKSYIYTLPGRIIPIIKKKKKKKKDQCGVSVVDHKLGSPGLMVIYLIPNSWDPPGLC